MKEELGTPLTLKEFQPVIKKLSLHKAPGLNEMSSNTLRALDFGNTKSFFIICCNFFNNEIHIPEWQTGNLKILPKKGYLSNTNNWRGIKLLGATSKVIYIVITCRF